MATKINAPQSAAFGADPLVQALALGVAKNELPYYALARAETMADGRRNQYLQALMNANKSGMDATRLEGKQAFIDRLIEKNMGVPSQLAGLLGMNIGSPEQAAIEAVAQAQREANVGKTQGETIEALDQGGHVVSGQDFIGGLMGGTRRDPAATAGALRAAESSKAQVEGYSVTPDGRVIKTRAGSPEELEGMQGQLEIPSELVTKFSDDFVARAGQQGTNIEFVRTLRSPRGIIAEYRLPDGGTGYYDQNGRVVDKEGRPVR